MIEGHSIARCCRSKNHLRLCTNRSDLLLRFNLSLVGEEIVDVRHCLWASRMAGRVSRRIHSHPQALSQCSEFLSALRECEGVSAANTALAAKHCAS